MTAQPSARGYSATPPPRRFNMARYCLAGAAAATPDKPALVVVSDIGADTSRDEVWTFSEFEDAVLRLARGLRDAGLSPGDRLLIRLGNTSLFPLTFFAALAAGIVALPASDALSSREIDFLIRDSEAAAVAIDESEPTQSRMAFPSPVLRLTADELRDLSRQNERANWADTAADDPAYLIYTSGTTAEPKGVLHAHRAAWGRRPMYNGWYGIDRDDRMLHAGAFNWTFTLGTGLTDPWANGATAIVYTGHKSPEAWPRLINRTEATLFAAVPGVFRQILKYTDAGPIPMPSLRHGLIAGETPPPGLFEEWRERTGTELHEALGMSELSTYISTAPGVTRRPDTVGLPQPGRRVCILPVHAGTVPVPIGEEGLIAVRRSDPGLMLGYWKRPDEEAQVFRGDWFVGGDLGRMDKDGYVTHLGRANDIMKAQGYRVAPQEVEAVLSEHAAVAEVACAEIRVRSDVTVIGAFIVPADPYRPPRADDIVDFARQRLAGYKVPREIRFVTSLPRTANGKLIRGQLAAG